MKLIKNYDGKVIHILGSVWTIHEDARLQDNEDAYGMVDFDTMQIRISPTLKPSMKLKVIMHEIGHILHNKYHRMIGTESKVKQEECFCELFEDFAYSLITENNFSKLEKKDEGKEDSKKGTAKTKEGRK
jgi:Zn-dependent peptidase ImmA (M78 family)